MGMEDMLQKISQGDYTSRTHDMFIRGVSDEQRNIVLDLERDSYHVDEITMSVDIDSAIWTTFEPRMALSCSLHLMPPWENVSPLNIHNHGYVQLLHPPPEAQRSVSDRTWDAINVSQSAIPNTIFATVNQWKWIIAFPRMFHRHEHTGERETVIPHWLRIRFWEMVVLPAVKASLPPWKDPYFDHSVQGFMAKSAGSGGGGEKYKGYQRTVTATELEAIVKEMRRLIISFDEDPLLGRFGSFFFILEARGIKLSTQSRLDDRSPSAWELLMQEHPQFDWRYMSDRRNGEFVVDVGVSFHPAEQPDGEPVTGLWRLAPLIASYAVAGYKKPNVHHAGMFGQYGGMSAEITAERGRRQHVTFRQSYNLAYEAVRTKDNQGKMCRDAEAYEYTARFREAVDKKIATHEEATTKSWGVREEYRMACDAVPMIMEGLFDSVSSHHSLGIIPSLTGCNGVYQARKYAKSGAIIWVKSDIYFTWQIRRMKEWKAVQKTLRDLRADNLGVLSGLIMHFLRMVDTTPSYIPTHVSQSLNTLRVPALMETYGTLFLRDLDIHCSAQHLPAVQSEDSTDVLRSLGRRVVVRKRKDIQSLHIPDVEQYPIGETPTWPALKEAVATAPWLILRPLTFHGNWDVSTAATKLFISFTTQMFVHLDESQLEKDDIPQPTTLEQAMQVWSPQSIFTQIHKVTFLASNSGIIGVARGSPQPSFAERMETFFPVDRQTIKGKWRNFMEERIDGYLHQYFHEITASRTEDERGIRGALVQIFANLQCLPRTTPTSPWVLSDHPNGGVEIITNPVKYRILGLSKHAQAGSRATRRTVTRRKPNFISALAAIQGRTAPAADRIGRKAKAIAQKSNARRNWRAPPTRQQPLPHPSLENNSEEESNSSTSNTDSEGDEIGGTENDNDNYDDRDDEFQDDDG